MSSLADMGLPQGLPEMLGPSTTTPAADLGLVDRRQAITRALVATMRGQDNDAPYCFWLGADHG
jgi:hypothetical protein